MRHDRGARLPARGLEVLARPSPWRLGPDHADLAVAWLDGWAGAAIEQSPEIGEVAEPYRARRLAAVAAGAASVVVHHLDLLALPRR